MKLYKRIVNFSLVIILLSFPTSYAYSKTAPSSFADLAEKLMPSVVNIASTQIVKTSSSPFSFQFPPGSPFEDMFKEFNRPTEKGSLIGQKGDLGVNWGVWYENKL